MSHSAHTNAWQNTMYDAALARRTIGSASWREKSRKEVEFICSTLGLTPHSSVLDVACGTGRHAIEFARKDHCVLGIDISSDCIELAKNENAHPSAEYRLGDMRYLGSYREKFDITVNLFSSFGYFKDDQENFEVLESLAGTLKKDGHLVINLVNRDWLLSVFQASSWTEDADFITAEMRNYDTETKYNESRSLVMNKATGTANAYYHRIRLYNEQEMRDMLKQAGFAKVQVYGNSSGEAISATRSSHPFYIATRT